MSCFTCGAGWAVWGTGERKYCFNCKPLHATLPQPKALCPYQVTHQDTQNTRPSFRNSDPPICRNSDPITSRIAAHLVDTTKREQQVLNAFIAVNRPMCNEQVADSTGDDQYSNISSRVTSLRRKGFLRWNGAYHKSRQGRNQRVNQLVNAADRPAAIRQFMEEQSSVSQ